MKRCECCGSDYGSEVRAGVVYCPLCFISLRDKKTDYFRKLDFSKASIRARNDIELTLGISIDDLKKSYDELNARSTESTAPSQSNDANVQNQLNSTLNSWDHASRFSTASGKDLPYVVLQVTLKEKLIGTGSANLTDLEEVINTQVAKGYRLHTMSTSNGGSKGIGGGDRIQATLVFERLDLR